ncbi:MAG TPA: serine/threonine-protein kinase [Thermoanaerobaculia bacterium]|nr:serine/threonine-protein kinase [Thermoanaerobaculia bacterium]
MNPGEILDGRYEIVQRLGAGGMGEVYKATHLLLGASRVIKVVHPNISTNTDARERFLREARAATKVQHPNVATVHDFAALPDGSHYMVWEFIDGENLAQRLKARGPLPPRNAVRIAIQALRGLEAIHRAGIVHRDISPENLMISHADDTVKIIDLGVAKIEEDVGAGSATKTGIFVGKLRYASPEQLGFLNENERIDGRADLYALAMVVVELLTGRPPYEAKSPHEYFVLHAREATLSNTVELPKELPGSAALQAALEKALARDRNARYASAAEFASTLEEIDKTLPDPRNLPTMAMPLDGDETMKLKPGTAVDTLHRETVREAAPTAAATVLTPMPAAVPQPQVRKGLNPAWIIAFVAVAVLITAAAILWPREAKSPIVQLPESTTSAAPAPTATHASETSVTVTSPPTETAVQLSAPPPVTTTTATVAPTPTPKPVVVETPHEEPAPTEQEPETTRAVTYVEGGNSARNERALDVLRRELRGVRSVSLRGSGGTQIPLARAFRQRVPDVDIDGDAEVIIRYNGSGRQGRFGLGSVSKGERVIFRYESLYGSTPEAFANIVAEAMSE